MTLRPQRTGPWKGLLTAYSNWAATSNMSCKIASKTCRAARRNTMARGVKASTISINRWNIELRAQPLTYLLVAGSVGFALGFLLTKRR